MLNPEGDDFGSKEDLNFCEKLETLGSGSFGVVYKCKMKETNETIAIKKIKIDLDSEGIPSTALREICILRDLTHPNIVELKDVVCTNNKLFLIFEYLEIDLKQFLELNFNSLTHDIIRSYMFQILSGVEFCHLKRIIHRDLKPQNLLLNQNMEIKLADFGLARAYSLPSRPYTKEVLTLWYRCPEILLGEQEYTKAIDIWSIGCIFAEFYLNCPLFQGDSDLDQILKIFKILGTPDEERWPGIKKLSGYKENMPKFPGIKFEEFLPKMEPEGLDLLQKMLIYDPIQRITAKDALKHPYFKNLKKK